MEVSQEMIKGTVVPIILKLLSEDRMYGYEIIKTVNERTGNAFQWKEGTIYPWLHRLEGDGLICSQWEVPDSGRKRKYYRITSKGQACLADKIQEWSVFAEAVSILLFGPPPA